MSAYEQFASFLRAWTAVPDRELAKAAEIFQPAAVPRGTIFLHAGEIPQTISFIVSGLARLYYIEPSGLERTKAFRLENQFVCAYSALLRGEPSRLFIQMLEPSSLLIAPYQAYQRLAAGHVCWQQVSLKIAEWLYVEQEQRQSELLLDDATTRYLKFLAEYPGLTTRVKQLHIASYLGITPVSLSRIRAQLSNS
ncbi:Crp/Fnr family transcriptional regulator [Ktedonosporobacter rubrisoli]|uniref:Crp/Fnr family transcriptional regulator n=1 Tax=Ktedonosporobacter rubrisoli TaxID=2509675 RepID=A0A4V0YYL2_KTERU|nr:Crp/Fnr family transcriptional regulator [Ktedonosporobacter rubrisoli]QBD76611.1 Crp/Fnr family transcriptional regulator [Ktedonosporobacter rubrisoli]